MIGLTPRRNLQEKQHTLLLKTTKHGAVQFMSWMKYLKSTYMDYRSGKPAHVQGYVFSTHHLIQYQ